MKARWMLIVLCAVAVSGFGFTCVPVEENHYDGQYPPDGQYYPDDDGDHHDGDHEGGDHDSWDGGDCGGGDCGGGYYDGGSWDDGGGCYGGGCGGYYEDDEDFWDWFWGDEDHGGGYDDFYVGCYDCPEWDVTAQIAVIYEPDSCANSYPILYGLANDDVWDEFPPVNVTWDLKAELDLVGWDADAFEFIVQPPDLYSDQQIDLEIWSLEPGECATLEGYIDLEFMHSIDVCQNGTYTFDIFRMSWVAN